MSYLINVDPSVVNTIHMSEEQLVQCCNTASGGGTCPSSQGCNGGNSDDVSFFSS